MDWKAHLTHQSTTLDTFRKAHPDAAKGFTALHHGTLADGALSVREKELQALAIGIVKQCTDCIGFHVQAAHKAGATRAQVAETVGVAMMMGGGPAFMYGAKALEAWDQLAG
jgi:AhpD family alkylhydroperoxidase